MRVAVRRIRILPFAALLCAGVLVGRAQLNAQGRPSVATGRLAVSPTARFEPGKSSWPSVSGSRRGACSSPTEIALRYWHYNRHRFLPSARPVRAAAAPADAANTDAARGSRDWLLTVARTGEPLEQAGALRVIGCAGAALGGRSLLERTVADSAARPELREAALLGLGEHSGAGARFLLVRAAADPALAVELRRVAVVAYGMTLAQDGARRGRSLASLARAAGDVDLRAAIVAAAALGNVDCVALESRRWLAAARLPDRDDLPATAAAMLVSGLSRADAARALHPLLGAERAELAHAARCVGAAHETASAVDLDKWLGQGVIGERALTLLACVGRSDLPAIVDRMLVTPTLAGVAAFVLALDVRLTKRDRRAALTRLEVGRKRGRKFADRPLWLLAEALLDDPTVAPRALELLREPRTASAQRIAAVDALVIGARPAPAEQLDSVREALVRDPDAAVRAQAIDVLVRHRRHGDVAVLLEAVDGAPPAERPILLEMLGRARSPWAERALRRHCTDRALPVAERIAAWRGLAHCVRHSGPSTLQRLGHGVRFAFEREWLLALR